MSICRFPATTDMTRMVYMIVRGVLAGGAPAEHALEADEPLREVAKGQALWFHVSFEGSQGSDDSDEVRWVS